MSSAAPAHRPAQPGRRTPARRLARTGRVGIAAAATAFLALTGVAPVATAAVSAGGAPASSSAVGCATSPEARVRPGAALGVDPNTVAPAVQAAMQSKLQKAAAAMRAAGPSAQRNNVIEIKTYMHVITRADGTGGVTPDQVKKQIRVLNDGFLGSSSTESTNTRFRFVLAGTDTTASDDWYSWDNQDDREAKKALHVGGWSDLNVYVTQFADQGLLGYATFPRTVGIKRDGVVVLNDSLPKGSAAPFNEGDTLTHEVGHWLNLFHTFQGGCSYPGDEVSDTPSQDDGVNIFYCNESDDTCPDAGLDPVHNFMSYGDDPCLDRFTPGQSDRMYLSWQVLRADR